MTWEWVKATTENKRDTLSSGAVSLVRKVEATGLKLRESLGSRDHAAAVVKANTVWVSQNAEEPIDVAKAVAEWKVQEVNEAAELKVEQARRPI